MCQDSLQMSGDLVKFSHVNFWASTRLSRQWLVHVVNHAQLLIRGLSRFSTNIRSVSQVLTDALLGTTVYFSAVTRALSKSHTAPNTGVSGFSRNMRSVSTTLTNASLNTTESFSAVTCARSKSPTSPNTGCVGILRLYKCQVIWVNPHTCTCEYCRVFFLAATRARSKSHSISNMRFVKILYKHQISEINPCRRTSEHHQVVLGCDSCT